MPTYTYICEGKLDCQNKFEVNCSMSELDEIEAKLTCPSCKSKKVRRDYSAETMANAYTPKSLGILAERNSRGMSDADKLAKIEEGRNKGKKTWKSTERGLVYE